MKKVRVTQALIEKARKVFTTSGKSSVVAGEGLSRQELRALERKGLVERLPTFDKKKWREVSPTKRYIWRWKDV